MVLGKAVMDRRRGENAAVAAAPADDDVGAASSSLMNGCTPAIATIRSVASSSASVSASIAFQPRDRFTGTHASPQVLPADLRVEVAELESRQTRASAARSLDDPHVEVDAAVGAGVARRADDHRHPELARRQQHVLEIVRLPGARARRGIGPERNRADVVAAGVGRDAVRPRRDAKPEAFDADRRKTQVPVRADDAKRAHEPIAGKQGER